jgi:hypothetical protein
LAHLLNCLIDFRYAARAQDEIVLSFGNRMQADIYTSIFRVLRELLDFTNE